MSNQNSKTSRWWRSLKYQECPITLESLSTLPYPPFSLKTGENLSYFDGLALASYIVSRGVFQNPLTRQDLSMEDCRRLDDYLDSHCHKYQRQYRKVSVAEVFALRAHVHIGQRENDSRSEERVQALRNTAAAALAGLFIYGNSRPSPHQTNQRHNASAGNQVPADDQLMLDWGFDLSRTFENSSEFASEGWTVIDDDEALVTASQRDAYQLTQASFPRLDGVASASESPATPGTDEYIVDRVRSVALTEEHEDAFSKQRLELAQRRLLLEALHRRKQRKVEKLRMRAANAKQWEMQKQEEEETRRARTEIESWREEQWERLRILSEAKDKEQQRVATLNKSPDATIINNRCTPEKDAKTKVEEDGPTEKDIATRKKATAAAKRKRARARKKAQKAMEQSAMERKKNEESLSAKKAASKVQCAACSQGMLGSGFEKFGLKFCSTKCARSAKPLS